MYLRKTERKPVFSSNLVIALLLLLFMGVALYFRVAFVYHDVFTTNWIKFTGNDAYFQMRLVDIIVNNFPHLGNFDPYLQFPGGMALTNIHLFNWLLASIAWVVGLGSPTEHTVDVIGVYFPAILGALTILPVYFAGKALFGRWAGLISAALLAILPGEFLGRSILGFTDQHVAETLLTATAMLFLILAIKSARQNGLSFAHLAAGNWAVVAKPLVYSLLAGFFLGLYILTWIGALLFVFVIGVYFVIQFVIDHLRQRPTEYLFLIGAVVFAVTLVMSLPASPGNLTVGALVIAFFMPLVLGGISWLMTRRKLRPVYYPAVVVGLGLIGAAAVYGANPSLLRSMLGAFGVFAPSATLRATLEAQALLFPGGTFSLAVAWGNFTVPFFLSIISLAILIYLVVRRGDPDKTLLVVWSLVILVATLAQRRFAYYFVVNVALLGGFASVVLYYLGRFAVEHFAGRDARYLWSRIIGFVTFSEGVGKPTYVSVSQKDYYQVLGITRKAPSKEVKRAFRKLRANYLGGGEGRGDEKFREIIQAYQVLSNPRKRADYDRSRYGADVRKLTGKSGRKGGLGISATSVSMTLGTILVVFVMALFPYPPSLVDAAKSTGAQFGKAWWDSCLVGKAIATAKSAPFAPSDAWCSSLSWLKDNTPEPFGDAAAYYQLPQLPTGGSYQYPESAYGVMAWWDYGYWITRIGHRIPNANPAQDPQAVTKVATYFTAQDESSGSQIAQEVGTGYVVMDYETITSKFWAVATWAGKQPTDFFAVYWSPQDNSQHLYIYPEYYRSLAVRLYNFDGKAVTPTKSVVISYQDGEVLSEKEFSSYEEAEAYISSQKSGNYRIVGTDPLVSPVPLEELQHYKLVYSSQDLVAISDTGQIPAIKIFEFTDRVPLYGR
jgi:oligosaccharyl transferase (archaeosortase A-associated)